MRQLSQTPRGSFSTLWPPSRLSCNILQVFSILCETWTLEMSTAPSSCAAVPNPGVTQPPYSYCLLYLAIYPGNLTGLSAAATSGNSYAFHFPQSLSWFSLSWGSLLLHKPDLHSLFLCAWPCICMSSNAYLPACPWLSELPRLSIGDPLFVYHLTNLQITWEPYQYFQNISSPYCR